MGSKMRMKKNTKWIKIMEHTSILVINLPCSCFSPSSLILLAACSAFFLSRQILDASWFLRWLVNPWLEEAPADSPLMDLNSASRRQIQQPIASSFCGSGRGSLPSPCLALPLCDSWYGRSGQNTGSVKSGTTWESSVVTELQSRLALGPLDWALYCQKYGFTRVPSDRNFCANLAKSSLLSPTKLTEHSYYKYEQLNNWNVYGTYQVHLKQ